MQKVNEYIKSYFDKIVIALLLIILTQNCNRDFRTLSKKVNSLSSKIDSLQEVTVTKKDLQIEGLRSEKRMIQSVDRKILDVNRQSEIDKEIQNLSK
jgi:hypothetical protein